MPRQHNYRCPCPGCPASDEHPPSRYTIETVRGWKHHLSHTHAGRGWTEEELQQAVSQGKPEVKTLDALIESAPESAAELGSAGEKTGEPVSASERQAAAPAPPSSEVKAREQRDAVSRKLRANMRQIKRTLSESIPRMIFGAFAKERGPEWGLTEAEASTIADAFDTMFDALGVEFEIEPWNVTLKSKLWLLAYPLAVIGGILAVKAAKEKQESKTKEEKNGKPA